MAVNINLYQNYSPPEFVNKNIKLLSTVPCVIKDDTDIMHPVIEFSFPLVSGNYCFIPVFSRYYYINQPSILRGKQSEIRLDVDALMSFKSTIYSSNVIAERATNHVNKFLPDIIPLEARKNIIYKRLTGGVYDLGSFGSDKVTDITPSILVSVINGRSDTPNTPTLSLSSISGKVVNLAWTEIESADYQLFRLNTAVGEYEQIYSGTALTYADDVLVSGTFKYKVRATVESAVSPFSNEITAVVN